jgi:hypothetical protein
VPSLDGVAAATLIRTLLSGGIPNGTPPEAFGECRDLIDTLVMAYNHGGTAKVREAWTDAVARCPAWAELVSGDRPTATPRTRWTTDELLTSDFPPLNWVVPDLLLEELTVLAGRPKLGKSWLALQIGQAVACGGRVFGQMIEPGPVLYLALEDNARRLQRRLQQQHWPADARATFCFAWATLDRGGLAALQTEMTDQRYRLIVIDTLSRAFSGTRNQNDIGEMTEVLGSLQRLALDHGGAILGIDHHGKPHGTNPDPVDDILGSTGKGAVADCLMGLYRERGKQGAILRVVGRDLDADRNLALEWDGRLCCWQLLGNGDAITKNSLQAVILDAFARLGGQATTRQVARYVGKDEGNVSHEIAELVSKAKIERGQKQGRKQPYHLPETSADGQTKDREVPPRQKEDYSQTSQSSQT